MRFSMVNTRKKKALSFVIFVILIFIFAQHYHLHRQRQKAKWQQVTKGNITQVVTAVGTLEPKQIITVSSMIPGTVDKLFHDEGSFVKMGTPLMRIKPNPTPAAVAQDKRTLEQKIVDERLAEQTLTRYKQGIHTGAISQDDFTKAKQAYKDAKVQRQLAQEQLGLLVSGSANIDGENVTSTIVSPINGYILKRYVDVGSNVVAQTQSLAGEVLFTIANMQQMIFKGQIDEIDAGKLKIGMPAQVSLAALPEKMLNGKLSLIALQSEQDAATIESTGKTATVGDNSTGTTSSPFNVGFAVQIDKLQLPKSAQLRAGYSATATITVKTLNNVLLVPESAIIPAKGDSAYIYINVNGKPKKHLIKIGIADGMHVQVISGLTLGQQILPSPPLQQKKS